MAKTGSPQGPPNRVGFPIGDLGPATFAALGILAALRQRDHTNRGQHIDVSMYDVLVSWLWDDPLDEYQDRGDPPRSGNRDPRGAPSNSYACLDGWVNAVVTDDRQWAELAAILGRDDLALYDTNVARVEIASMIDEAIGAWCRDRSGQDVVTRLRTARIPVAEVVAPWDARTNAHARARNILEPLGIGRRSGASATKENPPPPTDRLGASTETVLGDLLGFDETALDELKSRGIIGD